MRSARLGALIIGLVAALFVALWLVSARDVVVGAPEAPPRPREPRLQNVVSAPLEREPEPELEPEQEPRRGPPLPKCRPRFVAGEGPPLELTLTGAGLPSAPSKPLTVEVQWVEDGQPRRHFLALATWKATFWLCDESELAVRRGPYRLRSQRVPRSGPVSLFLEPAAAPSELLVRTEHRGAALGGVRLSITGCEPTVTDDGGVSVTSCEEVEAPRHVVVRGPYRVAKLLLLEPTATRVTVPVLGREEVEPGRIGLGFVPGAELPVVGALADEGPAVRAGVKLGDEVLEVDGLGVSNIDETTPRIIGAPGSTVRLKLRRGADVLLLDVVRAPE